MQEDMRLDFEIYYKVQTAEYRAPEIVVQSIAGYGPPIDIWSAGCILCEMLSGQTIFTGEDVFDDVGSRLTRAGKGIRGG